MPASKISQLTALTASQIADGDSFEVLDSSASDNKRIILSELKIAISPFAPYTISAYDGNIAANTYVDNTNTSPIIIPFNSTLIALAASTELSETWVAEIHQGLTLIAGALLSITSATNGFGTLAINLNAGDALQVFANGAVVTRPRIILYLARR